MFYIIETPEQLTKFSEYNLEHSFIEPILYNDNYHPALTEVSAYYIKPMLSRTGFILPISHSETLSLSQESILSLFANKVRKAYVFDAKKVFYHLNLQVPVLCLKTAKFMESGEVLNLSTYNQPIQNWLYSLHGNRYDINRIVPISKLAEKYDNFINENKNLFKSTIYKKGYYKFYNQLVNTSLFEVERQGLKADISLLQEHHPDLLLDSMSDGEKVYTQYNQYTHTGRPSNAFNHVNFGALNKTDGTREVILPSNDLLVEFDYSSYHPSILAKLTGYDFKGEDIHTHLGKMYFDTEELTEEQYSEIKKINFRNLYVESKEFLNFAFFKGVYELTNRLYEEYRSQGWIESIISKKPIRGITSKTQILPYLLQSYETERNCIMMSHLQELMKDTKSKLVLYTYDSFLIDYSKSDGKGLLEQIQSTLETDGFTTSVKVGKNYNQMKVI